MRAAYNPSLLSPNGGSYVYPYGDGQVRYVSQGAVVVSIQLRLSPSARRIRATSLPQGRRARSARPLPAAVHRRRKLQSQTLIYTGIYIYIYIYIYNNCPPWGDRSEGSFNKLLYKNPTAYKTFNQLTRVSTYLLGFQPTYKGLNLHIRPKSLKISETTSENIENPLTN